MLEKSIVRFFKSTGTGYVPLDWAMFNHGFYKQQKDFQVPIAKWVDGLAAKPFQLLYKEGKIYQVAKVNTVGTWAGLDVVEIKGLMGIVRDFKPATYILQDVVIYNDALYVCKKEGFHVSWNPDNWVLATFHVSFLVAMLIVSPVAAPLPAMLERAATVITAMIGSLMG